MKLAVHKFLLLLHNTTRQWLVNSDVLKCQKTQYVQNKVMCKIENVVTTVLSVKIETESAANLNVGWLSLVNNEPSQEIELMASMKWRSTTTQHLFNSLSFLIIISFTI